MRLDRKTRRPHFTSRRRHRQAVIVACAVAAIGGKFLAAKMRENRKSGMQSSGVRSRLWLFPFVQDLRFSSLRSFSAFLRLNTLRLPSQSSEEMPLLRMLAVASATASVREMSRRRERRRAGKTNQPWWGRLLAIAGAIVFVAVIAGYFGLRGYLHSEAFRRFLSAEVGQAIKADGQFALFRWDGLQVATDSFEAHDGKALESLRADNLRTEIGFGGLKRGVWELRESDVGRLDVSIDARGDKLTGSSPSGEASPKPSTKPSKKGWLPSDVELLGLTVRELSLRSILRDGLLTANGMKVRVDPAGRKNAYHASIDGGEVHLPWNWAPPVRIDRVKARWQDGELFLTEANATLWKHGRLQADGEWNQRTGLGAFQGTVTDLNCADLLNADWAKRLTGKAESTFTLELRSGGPVARGTLQVRDGVLTALPFLDSLAAYADTQRFRVLPLSEAHTLWEYESRGVVFRDLVVASEGLIRIEGTLAIRDRQLDGSFRLGLAPGTLARIPGAETDVFLPGERGLLWAPLRITGTLDDPKEDLTTRLIAAAGMRMFDVLPETGERVLKFSRTVVDHVPLEAGIEAVEKGLEKGVETGVKAIDKADDLLNGVNRALDGLLGGGSTEQTPPPPPEPPSPNKEGGH
jgi:hypothetical protein